MHTHTHTLSLTSIVSLVLLAYGCWLSMTRVRWVGCAGAAVGAGVRASRARDGSRGSYAAAKASFAYSVTSAFAVRAWRSLNAATPRLASTDAGADNRFDAGVSSASNAGSSDGASSTSRCTRARGTADGSKQMPDACTLMGALDASPSGRMVNRRPCSSGCGSVLPEASSICW